MSLFTEEKETEMFLLKRQDCEKNSSQPGEEAAEAFRRHRLEAQHLAPKWAFHVALKSWTLGRLHQAVGCLARYPIVWLVKILHNQSISLKTVRQKNSTVKPNHKDLDWVLSSLAKIILRPTPADSHQRSLLPLLVLTHQPRSRNRYRRLCCSEESSLIEEIVHA